MSATVAAGAGEAVAAAPADQSGSINSILAGVVVGAVVVALLAGGFFLWLSRRRANRHALPDLTGEGAIHTVVSQDEPSPKKLQKLAWSTRKSRIVSNSSSSSSSSSYSLRARRYWSLPILSRFSMNLTGRLSLVSSLSKRSSGPPKPTPSTRHRRNPSWIDEDALHGPATSWNPQEPDSMGKGKEGSRESWPMLNRSPTLPRLCHSLYGDFGYEQHWQEQVEKDTMAGAVGLYPSSPDSYTQVAMEARSLPEPPQPAVTASRDRQAAPGLSKRMGHRYSNSEPPMRPKGNLNLSSSPVKSPPTTPSRQRNRQASTDSTLSEILWSTEKRLQEGYVSSSRLPKRSRTSAAALGKSQWFGTSRESLLDHRPYGGVKEPPTPPTAVHRSRSEAKPSSPKKVTISLENGGHSRQQSQTSTVSSGSNIEPGAMKDFTPGFHRNSEIQEPETHFLGIQSVRSSISSALSTIQSEDEVPERKEESPSSNSRLDGSKPVDPFSSAAWASVPHRPPTAHVHQTRTQRPPDLFRENLERSLRTSMLRSAVDQSSLLAEASKLPPLPPAPGGAKPHSFFREDCPGCCKLGQTKTIPVQTWAGGSIHGSAAIELPTPSRAELVAPPASSRGSGSGSGPKGPRSLSTNKTNVLNSIVLPPPPAAPNFIGINGQLENEAPVASTVPAESSNHDNRTRAGSRSPFDRDNSPSSPTRRASSRASPRIQSQISVSSSVYSQDPKEVSITSTVNANTNTNIASFQANSRINTSTTIPFRTVLKATSSSENMRLPKFTGFINNLKEVNSDADRENNRDSSRPPSSLGFGIASTVAELRRMNSGISVATSLAGSECGGYGSDSRPTTPTARLSGLGKSSHRKSGSGSNSGRKAYLSLGGTTPTSLQKKNRESKATMTTTSDTGSPTPRRRSGLASSSSVPIPTVVELTISPATPSTGSPIKKKGKTTTDSDDSRPAWGSSDQNQHQHQYPKQTTTPRVLVSPRPPHRLHLLANHQILNSHLHLHLHQKHRRHNSHDQFPSSKIQSQWGHPITVARIRDHNRTPSPPNSMTSPTVAPLAIPSKSPRRQQYPVFETFGGGDGKPKTPESKSIAAVGKGTGITTPRTGRRSVESLGLYDQDGFLISHSPAPLSLRSPVRCR